MFLWSKKKTICCDIKIRNKLNNKSENNDKCVMKMKVK